ncbi:MAG TPA: YfhO family protein [Anaerolineales bacterium]|nr:YfhO family protein [Anaerolineales bacterium]
MSPSHRVTLSLKRAPPYLTLIAAWALFFWRFAAPSLADRVTYPAGDFTMQFGVFRDLAYRALAAGRFPLWADCLNSGYPLHADPQAQIFYPPVWLTFGFLRLGGWGHFPIEALVAEAAFHYLFLSLFLFLFLSSLKLRPAAALLGALVFTYGGYLTGSPPLQTATLETDTWLPLALLFSSRLAASRRLRDLVLAAFMLALAFLAGHPQTFVYVALLTITYFAYRAHQARWGFGAFAAFAAALTVLTAALTAASLLPSLHFISNSTRAAVAFDQAAHGFPFEDVLQFFLTGFVSHWHPLYVGLLPLGLAAFALNRRRPEVRFWAASALASLILSFGAKGVLYDVAYWIIPGFRLFRGQEHLALVVSFSLSVLAAFGAHHLLGPLARPARQWLNHLLRLGSVFFVVTIGILGLVTYLKRLGFDPSDWKRLPDRVGVLTLGAGLALMLLAFRVRVPSLRRWIPALCVSVVVLDLFAANRPLNVVPLFETYPYNPLLDPITQDRNVFFRVQDVYQLPGHAGCAYRYREIGGITPYQIATYARFVERAPESIRWQLLGVKYVVTWQQDLAETNPLAAEASSAPSAPGAPNAEGITRVYRLAYTPRRAFLAHQVSIAPTDEAVYRQLASPTFNPFKTVLLSQSVDAAPAQGDEDLAIVSDAPGHLRLRTTSAAAAVLVVSEAYFPGWRATVDGRAAPLLRADGALLAVGLPSGAHEIELVYGSVPLAWGGVISILALVVALGLLGLDALRGPRRRQAP